MHSDGRESRSVASTTHHLSDVARTYLTDLEQRMLGKPREILEAWPQVAGEFARMTRASKFEQKILYVLVGNSTLLSVLHQKKALLLAALRAQMPEADIVDIMFRMG